MIGSRLVKGSPSDALNAMLFGGLAGGLTGAGNYYFHSTYATPVVIINEGAWQIYTGDELE